MSGGKTWRDWSGRRQPLVTGPKLSFQRKLHRILRVTVFRRDRFTCQWCGVTARFVPLNYDGRLSLLTTGFVKTQHRPVPGSIGEMLGPRQSSTWLFVDHIVTRRLNPPAMHHPDNLQTLCTSCNSAKRSLVDVPAFEAQKASA